MAWWESLPGGAGEVEEPLCRTCDGELNLEDSDVCEQCDYEAWRRGEYECHDNWGEVEGWR